MEHPRSVSAWSRRRFLGASGATALSALVDASVLSSCGDGDDAAPRPPEAPPRQTDPPPFPTSATRAAAEEIDVELRVLEGRLPRDLGGSLFITTPIPYGDGTHVFVGDGMTYRIGLEERPVRLVTRFHRTPCFLVDRAARGTEHAFQNAGLLRASPTLGVRNQLNTAYVNLGDALVVTHDPGRPWVMDPRTLDLVTPLGSLPEWRPQLDLPGRLFPLHLASAHPYEDPSTGELFTVAYGVSDGAFLELVRVGPDGSITRFTVELPDGSPAVVSQCVHQIAGTETHLVLADCAFLVEPELLSGLEVTRLLAPTTKLFVIARADLGRAGGRVTAVPSELPGEVEHFTADHASPRGELVVHTALVPGMDVSERILRTDRTALDGAPVRQDLLGYLQSPVDASRFARYRIEASSGRILSEEAAHDPRFTFGLTLYTHRSRRREGGVRTPDRLETMYWVAAGFHPALYTERMRDLYAPRPRTMPREELSRSGIPGALVAFEAQEMRIRSAYAEPRGRVFLSPQFVPRPGNGSARDGYVVLSVASDDRGEQTSGDELWVLDARDLAKGPLCRLGHPRLDFARPLHTTWLRELSAPPPALRRIAPREDHARLLAATTPEIRSIFERALGPGA